jgi:hypothetical protein
MNREYCIPRILTLELLYPAVLGSVFYTLFTSISYGMAAGQATGFLAGAAGHIALKVVLFAVTLSSFSADFTYTTWCPDFQWAFFILDVAIVSGLYLIFSATALTSTAFPNSNLIALGVTVILLCYFLWDCFDPALRATPILKRHMFIWEMASGGALLVEYLFHRWSWISDAWAAWSVCGILAASTVFFWRLVLVQRRTLTQNA